MALKNFVLCVAVSILLCASAYGYETRLLSEIPVKGKATAIAVNRTTHTAAVASASTKTLTIIDTRSHAVILEVPLPTAPSGVAMHTASNRVLVSTLEGSLLLYDLQSGEPDGTVTAGAALNAVAVDEVNNKAFLGTEDDIKVVDMSTLKVLPALASPGSNVHLSLTKSLLAAVVRDAKGSKLRLIDPAAGQMIAETSIPGDALSIGVDDSLGYILITQRDTPGISLYDAATLKPLPGIPTGKQVQIISINPSTHMAVLADTVDGSLSVADLIHKVAVATVPLYGQMGPLCVDTARNTVLAAHNETIMVIQLENPVPRITGLVPQERGAGEEGFPLTVIGEKFVSDSHTRFGGTLFDSLFQSNELLSAIIPAEKLLSPGDVPVSVINPPPGGGISNELTFKVLTPAPQLSGINPATAAVGSSFTLRVEGKNFLPTAVVNFNGNKVATNFLSSTMLEAPIAPALMTAKGSYAVSVTSNGPTSFTSNSLSLAVVSAEEAAQIAKTAGTAPASPVGAGSLHGRILTTESLPLPGVTIRFKGISTITDNEGKFNLYNLPAGKRTILVDGSTVPEIDGHYPVIPLSVDINAGVNNAMPFVPYLHRQKHRNFVKINPSTDTVLTDPEVPGFELRVPKGVKIIGWDGKANLEVSVRTVPIDRLPVKPLPKNAYARTVYMFYFNKVGGGKPDQPIPVKAPNDLGLLPGEKAVLWYYDESPNEGEAPNDWAIAGTGTVTADGRFIVSDPGSGIPKFCCGASTYGGGGGSSPSGGGGPPCGGECCGPSGGGGDPVNVATGYFMHEKTDYKVNGIIPVEIKRFYRSGDQTNGAFGIGTYFGYDWWLGINADMLLLIKPGNYQYRFYKQADGTFINTTDPEYGGDIFYNNGDGTYTLKKKDGWSYKLGADRLLDKITDPNGNALTFLKEFDGNITTIIMPDGQRINMTYQPGGVGRDRLTSISGPLGTVTYTLNNGELMSVQYPDGGSVSYGYDASGRMTSITENGKLVVTNVYDTNDRVSTQTHSDGGIYTFSYTLAGSNVTETAMTSPNSATTTWRFYDDSGAYHNGYILKITTPDGATVYELQPGTNVVNSVTDPLSRKTSFMYDTKGRLQSKTDVLGNTTRYEYEDTCSNTTKITNPLNKSTTFSYTFAPGNCRKTRTEVRDPLQNLTVIEYDSYGMPTRITDPNGNPTTLAYAPAYPGQLSSISDPLGNTVRYGYDDIGRITSIADAKGAKTTFAYSSVTDRINSVIDPMNGTTRYSYDLNGNLGLVTDDKGNSIAYEYDDRNRITKMTDQLGRYETFSYYRGNEITPSTGSNLKSYVDRKGQTTMFDQYDALGRVQHVTFNDGAYLQYTYDAAGRTTNIYDSLAGSIGYTYNDYGCTSCSGRGINEIAQETIPLGTINYTYDANGRRATMTVQGEPVVNYGYDDAGRLTSLTRVVGSGTRTYKLGYDNGSRRSSLEIPLANGADHVITAYGYDIANRVTRMLLQGGTTQIDDVRNAYDAKGNRTSSSRSASQNWPSGVTSTSHDFANEMLGLDGKTFTYDQNGNLATRADICGTTTFTWDARNRLIGISGYNTDCSTLSATFGYDSLNRRISRTINGVTTQYLYDRWDIVQQIAGGVKTDYVRSLNIDEPLTRINGSTIRHYVKDALGSVMGLTDDTGAIKTSYTSDAFGNVTTTGEASDNPFQFTARENDGTGLYYYRARYYSPEMQRFISEDPIRGWGGINFYTYVRNNPINRIDPFGLQQQIINTVGGVPIVVDLSTGQASVGLKTNYVDTITDYVRQTINSIQESPDGIAGVAAELFKAEGPIFLNIEEIWKRIKPGAKPADACDKRR